VSEDDKSDRQLQLHEARQPRENQTSLWSTHCSKTDNVPLELCADVTIMSSASRNNVEGVEGEINDGLQQTSEAPSMVRHLLSETRRRDYGRLQIVGGSQANELSPLVVVIDRRVRKIISFARQVPGFDTLIVDDQIRLIKRQFATQ